MATAKQQRANLRAEGNVIPTLKMVMTDAAKNQEALTTGREVSGNDHPRMFLTYGTLSYFTAVPLALTINIPPPEPRVMVS